RAFQAPVAVAGTCALSLPLPISGSSCELVVRNGRLGKTFQNGSRDSPGGNDGLTISALSPLLPKESKNVAFKVAFLTTKNAFDEKATRILAEDRGWVRSALNGATCN